MLEIRNDSLNPHYNLALEEHLVTSPRFTEDTVVLWQNEPTVVIGRNQNAELQVNRTFLNERGIHLARRLSGGGAVYHDAGNLNFTVIKRNAYGRLNDFSFFTQPVVDCLGHFGIRAEFSGRNDITVDGKKFSGNAQYRHHDTVLHHGTILFSSDLSVLSSALIPKKRIEVPGVQSVAARVTNLAEYLPSVSLEEFRDALVESLVTYGGSARRFESLDGVDVDTIRQLAQDKYGTDRWRWGASPAYNWVREARLSAGNVIACARVEEGVVVDFALFGDYFESEPVAVLEREFLGCPQASIAELAGTLPVERYIHGSTGTEMAALLASDPI